MIKKYFTHDELLEARRDRRRDNLGRTKEQYKERFLERQENGCWLWIGSKWRTGYGYVRVGGKHTSTHRYFYMLYKGDIGDKMVLHTCDIPACVNPDHLFLGTQTDNMRDCAAKGRHANMKGTNNPNYKHGGYVRA